MTNREYLEKVKHESVEDINDIIECYCPPADYDRCPRWHDITKEDCERCWASWLDEVRE